MIDRRKKLSDEQVREMRAQRKAGALLKNLATDFHVSMNWVEKIVSYKYRKTA